jgi:IS5 family transposase
MGPRRNDSRASLESANTITTGKSGLILDIDIHAGNPADATLVKGVFEKHEQFYGAVPKSAVFDGCYSSNDNREFAERVGIKNVCFSKETDEQRARKF